MFQCTLNVWHVDANDCTETNLCTKITILLKRDGYYCLFQTINVVCGDILIDIETCVLYYTIVFIDDSCKKRLR